MSTAARAAMIFGFVALSASPAMAQAPMPVAQPVPVAPEVSSHPQREGFVVEGGIGMGNLNFDNPSTSDSRSTFNYGAAFGGFLSSTFALQVEIWGGTHSEGNATLRNINRGLAAKYWIADEVFLKGRVGTADLTSYLRGNQVAHSSGRALGGVVGYEIMQSKLVHMLADISFTAESFDNSSTDVGAIALEFGVTYY